jgi:hypothetical protein
MCELRRNVLSTIAGSDAIGPLSSEPVAEGAPWGSKCHFSKPTECLQIHIKMRKTIDLINGFMRLRHLKLDDLRHVITVNGITEDAAFGSLQRGERTWLPPH